MPKTDNDRIALANVILYVDRLTIQGLHAGSRKFLSPVKAVIMVKARRVMIAVFILLCFC